MPSDTEARLPQRERRVLVVEDDHAIASSLTADLKEFGFVVIGPAHNLADASAMASTSALDCALIDIALGVETALPVAQILADRQIPFVFMKGKAKGRSTRCLRCSSHSLSKNCGRHCSSCCLPMMVSPKVALHHRGRAGGTPSVFNLRLTQIPLSQLISEGLARARRVFEMPVREPRLSARRGCRYPCRWTTNGGWSVLQSQLHGASIC